MKDGSATQKKADRSLLGNHPDIDIPETHRVGFNLPSPRLLGVGQIPSPAFVQHLDRPTMRTRQLEPFQLQCQILEGSAVVANDQVIVRQPPQTGD
jgi:hypothetical protein